MGNKNSKSSSVEQGEYETDEDKVTEMIKQIIEEVVDKSILSPPTSSSSIWKAKEIQNKK